MTEQSSKSKFIGRTQELDVLVRAFETARSGEMATVIVGGEAGVGKTRLVREFLYANHGSSTTTLVSGCRDYGDSPVPFAPISEALRSLAKDLDDETRFRLLLPVQAELNNLLPDLESLSTVSKSSRSQLFERILTLIEAVAARGPLIMIVEDVQWADNSTRDLLAFLVATLVNERVMLVITYRSDELSDGGIELRYFAQLARQNGVKRINVLPFDYNSMLLHLEDIGGQVIEPMLADAIFERSQGNPFYAEELLASSDEGIPVNVRDALLSRIKSLSPAAQRVVRVAAAGGPEIHHEILAQIVDDDIDEALREAVHRQILLVNASETFVFRHALLQEVAYAQLMPGERQRVHARYASALQDVDAPAADLARHYLEANEVEAAFNASVNAAMAAEATRGFAESHVHYERALKLWPQLKIKQRPSGTDHIELLDQAAAMAHWEGNHLRAVELCREALTEASTSDPRVRILRVRLGTYLLAAGDSCQALIEHEAVAREMNGDPPSSTHAEVLCAYARSLMLAARYRESVRHAEEALTMARLVGDKIHEVPALTTLGSNLVVLGQPENGASYLYESLKLAEDLGHPGEIAAGYKHLVQTLSGPLNRLEEAYEVAQKGHERVTQLGLERHWGATLLSIASDTLFRLGRWDEALALVNVLIRRSPKGEAALDLLLSRIKLTVGQGDFELADADLAEVTALSSGAIDLRHTVPLATLRVGLALWRRDLDTAEKAFDEGLSRIDQTDDVWFGAPLVWHGMRIQAERADKARAEFRPEDRQTAVVRAEELRRLSEHMCHSGRQRGALRLVVDAYDVMCEGELLRVRGHAAPDVWSVVAASWAELGQPYPAAYANWRWAEALLARPGGAAKAASHLRSAHETSVRLGAAPLQRELEALAKRARIDLVDSPVNLESVIDVRESARERLIAEAGLTKREAEVLSLVADGKSNRGIAEVCFISEKTASCPRF